MCSMDDQGPRWFKTDNPDLACREWDGERVYHSARSGDTHMVTGVDLIVLNELERGPIGAAQLLVGSGDLDEDERAEMAVTASLDRLHRLGLAARQSP